MRSRERKPAEQTIARTAVRLFTCPSCGAAAGHACIGRRDRPRVGNHMERVNLALSYRV